ncbi:amidohydrolase [Acidobacterium sp. S8]|uniref:amidohydrolase family protein n=1 Tax=Acidobacterium sp. S8 TaxID=1641854 RepID=UPI00131B8686|nr:amidohydrolase family protein [Acidobacterium sp. S8]
MQNDKVDANVDSFRIDAHHHLWRYSAEEYGWIDDTMQPLKQDFLASELLPALISAHVDGAVAVQARQTIAETEWLLAIAQTTPSIWGVVGWLPISSPDFRSHLDLFSGDPLLKGLRHVVQAEAEGFLDQKEFDDGISAIEGAGLVYDILILESQLAETMRFVDRHPKQSFVLDHIAKPRIADDEIEPWGSRIRELSLRPNVVCKVSGMVTEADPHHWTPAKLQPYFDVVLDAFGPQRLMTGTDWPVLTLGCEYSQWWGIVEDWISPLTPDERAQILGGTAARVYGLQARAADAAQSEKQISQGESI